MAGEAPKGIKGVAASQCSHAGCGEASGHSGASSIPGVAWGEVFPWNRNMHSSLEGYAACPDCWECCWDDTGDCALSQGQDRGSQRDLYLCEPCPCLLVSHAALGVTGSCAGCRTPMQSSRMFWSCCGPMDGEEGAVLGASSMKALPQQGRRGLWGAPPFPGLTQALAFCRTQTHTLVLGPAGAPHQHRGCLPRAAACQAV